MLTASTSVVGNAGRLVELKTSLENGGRELIQEVHGKIRDGRSDYITERDVLDPAESSEVNIQDDIEFALIQLKAETLNKIDMALQRIAEATTGNVSNAVTRSPRHAPSSSVRFAVQRLRTGSRDPRAEQTHHGAASSLRFLDDAGF